jgi:hypothetical protein
MCDLSSEGAKAICIVNMFREARNLARGSERVRGVIKGRLVRSIQFVV